MDSVVPQAYLLSRNAPPGTVRSALAAFCITPLSCVLISDMRDYALASQFSGLVLKVASGVEAVEFALCAFPKTQMPSLIIAEHPEPSTVTAIRSDGSLERLDWRILDSTVN